MVAPCRRIKTHLQLGILDLYLSILLYYCVCLRARVRVCVCVRVRVRVCISV